MSNKKTALMELMADMSELKKTKLYLTSFRAIDDCIALAYNLIDKEKQQIVDSIVQHGIIKNNIFSENDILSLNKQAEEYYEKTFEQ